jgi:hypothetical protein
MILCAVSALILISDLSRGKKMRRNQSMGYHILARDIDY